MIRRLLPLGVLLVLSACGEDEPGEEQASLEDELLAPGPHAIGYRRTQLTYTPRGQDQERSIPVEIWYPAARGTGTATTYSVAGIVDVARPGVDTDADLAPGDPWPLLVYSHGNGGVGLVAFSWGEYFASHGWITLAMDHVGNTIIDRSNPFATSLLLRPQDVSAVLDWAESAPPPFTGRISDRVLAMGHSFGAYSVLSLAGGERDVPGDVSSCETANDGSCVVLADPSVLAALTRGFLDPRVDAVVAQAGSSRGYEAGTLEAIAVPVMLQSGKLDATVPWDPSAAELWDATGEVWVDLPRGGHYSFLEICEHVPAEVFTLAGIDVVNDGCGPGFTPLAEIVPVLEAYALAFGRSRVLGDARFAAVLAGEPLHADVEVDLRP